MNTKTSVTERPGYFKFKR